MSLSPRHDARQKGSRNLELCARDADSSTDESEPSAYYAEDIPDPCDLDEDVFALTICDVVRDLHLMAVHNRQPRVQVIRFIVNIGLLFVTLTLQVSLLGEVFTFVTSQAVHDIRDAYNAYEITMYGNDTSRMDVTVNGYYRGRPQYFNASLFNRLDDNMRLKICRIPLSQPLFFGVILWIWTTVCMGALGKTWKRMWCLIFRTKTCSSMYYAFTPPRQDAFSGDEANEDSLKIIYQLTPGVKLFFITCVIVPRFAINTYLLWVGCRWLLATTNFGNLVLNAVALEFVLEIGGLVFLAIAPERNKHDLSRTKMLPVSDKLNVTFAQMEHVLAFFVISISWVVLYMTRVQRVLPDYRWDVHAVCKGWLAVRFKA